MNPNLSSVEHNYHTGTSTKLGTLGGTLLTILVNINVHDIYKTAVFALIGAVVSFFVSLGLKYMVSFWKDRLR